MTFRKEKRKRNTKVSLRNLPKIAEPIEVEGPKKKEKWNVSRRFVKKERKKKQVSNETYPSQEKPSKSKPKDLKKKLTKR